MTQSGSTQRSIAWMRDPQHFGQLLGETARLWRAALDRRLAPLGLSQAQWLVLLHVSRAEDGLTQKELARASGVEAPTMVGLLDRMARNGWVERIPCPSDRRSKLVHLTERAQGLIHQIEEASQGLRAELLGGLSEAEIACCQRVLGHLRLELETLA